MELSYEELLERAYASIPERAKEPARFEPPKADVTIEGNKTIIRNFAAIADKLRRQPKQLARFLGKEFAAPATIDGARCIFAARVAEKTVNEKLLEYIKAFVLCSQCKKPDTKIVDLGRGLHILVCEACGARGAIPKL